MARLIFTTGEQDITQQFTLEGHPDMDLPGGSTVTYQAHRTSGGDELGPITATVVDVTAWTVSVTFPTVALDADGSYSGTTTVTAGDGRVWKFPGDLILIRTDRAEATP